MTRLTVLFGVLAGCLATVTPAHADEAAAWAALRQGGHVALMRHAATSGGAGDPPGFKIEDCATQRNLTAEGRADAQAVGAKLKAEKIAFGKISSSPWCRCVDTAKLLELGSIEIEATFSNAFVLREQRASLTEGARKVIAGWKGPGNLLVSTHGANIQALIGTNPGEGEIVVVTAAQNPREVGRIPVPKR